MRIAISNIAWEPAEDEEIAGVMRELSVYGVELALSKYYARVDEATNQQIFEVRRRWLDLGLQPVAVQSVLFGRPDLQLFGTVEQRGELSKYLRSYFEKAAILGARRVVFGNPKNRIKGRLSSRNAVELAVEFFRELARICEQYGITLCFEPNARQYGCDFLVTSAETISLIQRIDEASMGLHLDTGCLWLEGEIAEASVRAGIPYLKHFHISEPGLRPVGEPESFGRHAEVAASLRKHSYQGYASVEMRRDENVEPAAAVRDALVLATRLYGDLDSSAVT